VGGDILSIISDPLVLLPLLLMLDAGDTGRVAPSSTVFPLILEFGTWDIDVDKLSETTLWLKVGH